MIFNRVLIKRLTHKFQIKLYNNLDCTKNTLRKTIKEAL